MSVAAPITPCLWGERRWRRIRSLFSLYPISVVFDTVLI